jgi:hypothetical protein
MWLPALFTETGRMYIYVYTVVCTYAQYVVHIVAFSHVGRGLYIAVSSPHASCVAWFNFFKNFAPMMCTS